MGGGGALRPDGPVVWLTLPDGQVVSAVVRARRREPGGWWYAVEVPLWARVELADGRVVAGVDPAVCWAPATACEPVEGEDYSAVPTERPRRGQR
ncbi:hypothetical protein STBA_01140 [Streptomyces sp. MP131-18]|nr:hypothetical protein STBA_01140 [Streptomyces sp. MP131-18]